MAKKGEKKEIINPDLFERPLLQGQVGQLQGRVRVNKVYFLLRLCVHVGPAVLVVRSLVRLSKGALRIRRAIGKRQQHEHSGGEVGSMGSLRNPVVPNRWNHSWSSAEIISDLVLKYESKNIII